MRKDHAGNKVTKTWSLGRGGCEREGESEGRVRGMVWSENDQKMLSSKWTTPRGVFIDPVDT